MKYNQTVVRSERNHAFPDGWVPLQLIMQQADNLFVTKYYIKSGKTF